MRAKRASKDAPVHSTHIPVRLCQSAIDTDLPKPPQRTHLMLKYKANWVLPDIAKGDLSFDIYPQESIVDWHKRTGMWVE